MEKIEEALGLLKGKYNQYNRIGRHGELIGDIHHMEFLKVCSNN